MSDSPDGRIALVTGASRGIGKAMAMALAKDGHRLVVNYARNAEAAREVVDAIESAGGEALAIQADVSDEQSVAAMFDEAGERMGAPLILVNNAGITDDDLMLRMSAEKFDKVVSTNLRSAFLCTKAALKGMLRARWGRIVSVASVAGMVGNVGQANYAASKAGMIGLTKSVSKEVGSRGITANIVAPGFIETDMTGHLSDEIRAKARESVSMGRWGQPEEIAEVVRFLASEGATYITGQVIPVDGGLAL